MVETWSELGIPAEAANSLSNLAYAEARRGTPGAARRTWREAQALDPTLKERPFGKFLTGLIAEIHGEYEAAEAAFADAAAIEGEFQNGEWTWRATYGLARVAEARGRSAVASQHYRRALQIRRHAASRAPVQGGRASFLAERADLVRDAAAHFLKNDDVDSAFRILDEERGSTLRDLESRVRVERLDDVARSAYFEALGHYRRLKSRFEELPEDENGLRAAELKARRAERKKLQTQVQAAFDRAHALLEAGSPELSQPAVGSKAIAQALADDEALIAVHDFGDRSFRFYVDSSTVVARPSEAERPLPSRWKERFAGRSHLYVVALDETADRIPAALNAEDASFETEASWSLLPFASLLTTPAARPAGRAVVVADPRGDLSDARTEGRWVRENVTPAATRLEGGAAHRDAVLGAIDGAPLFHFAGHGQTAPSNPWDARLNLADDQTLTLEDIVAEQPALGLVVLSGCETGKRTRLSRRESVGLADAFLLSGATAVLASTRRVEDDDALRFIRSFYEKGGLERPAEAWRQTVLAERARGSDAADAFRLFGRRR